MLFVQVWVDVHPPSSLLFLICLIIVINVVLNDKLIEYYLFACCCYYFVVVVTYLLMAPEKMCTWILFVLPLSLCTYLVRLTVEIKRKISKLSRVQNLKNFSSEKYMNVKCNSM